MSCVRCGYDAGFKVVVCPQCGARVGRDEALTQFAAPSPAERRGRSSAADTYLFVRGGPDQGRQFPVAARTTIGRARTCTAALSDPRASLEHARIVRQSDAFVYIDELSSNRSFLLTARGEVALTGPHLLRDGDTIRVGHTVLQFIDARKGTR